MKIEDKIAAFRNMAESDPDNELAHFSLGKLLFEASEFAQAEASLRRALEIQPEYSIAHKFLAQSLLAQEKRADAVAALRHGIVLAHDRGDFMPRDAMRKLLEELGESVPDLGASGVAAPSTEEIGPDDVHCTRCQRVGKRLAEPPFSSAIGRTIHERICSACWKEWIGVSIKVINEYRLNMALPEANQIYDNHLREFLGLSG